MPQTVKKRPCLSLWERWPALAGRRGFGIFHKNQKYQIVTLQVFDNPSQSCCCMTELVEKGFAEFAAKAANPSKSFSAAACTWTKIHIRLQVWNLFVYDEQIMRAAACKNPSKSPRGDFRRSEGRPTAAPEQSVDKVIFMTENVGAAIGRPQCEGYVFAGILWKNLCFTAGPAMHTPTVFVEKSFFNTLAGRIWPFRYFLCLGTSV